MGVKRTTSPAKRLATDMASARRAAHFANGGTLASWRGRAVTEADRRAVARKQAARGRTYQEA